jgi:chlorobactene glucosyltransferase
MDWGGWQASLMIFFLAVSLIFWTNWRELRLLSAYGHPSEFPLVSVLIPARNEERALERCLRSLLAQDYGNFEVLVLDDQSSDGTAAIVQRLTREDVRFRLIRGADLPSDWLGKHWACQQLAEQAQGTLLLFTDADTVHHPQALANAVSARQREGADMLTAFPREILGSWGEKLTVPLFGWSFLCFQPVLLIHRTRLRRVSVAVGQFMLFRREALVQVGGFAAVRGDIADDLALARAIRKAGLRLRVLDGTDRVECRMYHGFKEALVGFSKNLFAAFRYNLLLFLFVWLMIAYATWSPLGTLLSALFLPLPVSMIAWSGAVALLSFLLWLFASPSRSLWLVL